MDIVEAAAGSRARPGVVARIPAPAWLATSAFFHYAGPAFAVLLFAQVDVLGVTWLRLATAAVILCVWRRPWRCLAAATWPQRHLIAALGLVLGAMNSCFYLAIERLPLATVAGIEFASPVLLAAAGVRNVRNGAALAAALAGIAMLSDVHLTHEPLGFAFAVTNCLLFMAYVILGHRIASDGPGPAADRLAVSMAIGLVAVTPLGAGPALHAFADPLLLTAAVGVGVCSSVIPYLCDQLAMARVSRSTFALMLALLPTTACLIGVVVLRQLPSAWEIAAIAAVVLGVALHQDSLTSAPSRKATS